MRRIARALFAALAVLCLLLASTAAVAKGGKDGGKDGDRKHRERERHDDGRDVERDDEEREGRDGREGDRQPEAREHRHAPVAAVRPTVHAAPVVAVQVLATPVRGSLLVTVLAARPAGDPTTVTLDARLPDVGAAWTLQQPDPACRIEGARLSCSFALAAGEVGLVQASAKVVAPPGWAAQATASAAGREASAEAGLLLL
jgi:hypothetical protein